VAEVSSPTCYAAALPFLVWALLILLGVSADATRVPFLFVEGVAAIVSIRGLRQKYRRHDAP
jgi:hypothetical protein